MHPSSAKNTQTGLGLVEILVALVLGLLTTLVIMQVFTLFERDKRTTTGSADAQTSGAIALYTIGRDLQLAGYGLLPATDSPLECDPSPQIDHDNNAATPGITLTPVTITDGGVGVGATDAIDIRFGSSPIGGIPTVISALFDTTVTIPNNLGCQVGDIALVVSGSNCAATRVTGPTDIATPPVLSDPPDRTHVTLESAAGVSAGANLACLGTWSRQVYAVNNGNLTLNGTPIISGIVNLQAQYGVANTADSNQVALWVNAVATGGVPWDAPTVQQRNRIKAVRIAVVARNSQYEKEEVTAACSSTTEANPTGLCAWSGSVASPAPTVNLSNDPDWQHYRYRVYETVIPLRNVIWSRDTFTP